MAAVESLETGDQELCLLCFVPLLVLVLARCVWRCCLAECRPQTAPHSGARGVTAGRRGCSWHGGDDQISSESIKRINR